MKISSFKLSAMVSRILIISGLYQSAVIQIHVKMINDLYSQIIGLFLFVFILLTIMNIMNGSNFTSKKSAINIFAIYLVSTLQTIFGILFIIITLNEVYWIPEVLMSNTVTISVASIVVSIVASFISGIVATIFYFRATEIDLYLS